VRADLPAGAQLAQSCHAVRSFAAGYPELDRKWYEGSNNLVALQVPDEGALLELRSRAIDRGLPVTLFREPDLGDSVTAIALMDARSVCSSLALALRT
jgi:peptidyl-tRNA hydrolase